MNLKVRAADLMSDREELIGFLSINLPQRPNASWFDWMYLNNPYGAARVWIGADTESGHVVGVSAAFPRLMSQAGRERRAWLLGDFCVRPENRSLGPALTLQRRSLTSLLTDDTVVYDFPSEPMMGVYRRLGLAAVGNQVRYVKTYRVDGKVGEWVQSPRVQRSISRVGNGIVKIRNSFHRRTQDLDVKICDSDFSEDFTQIERRSAKSHRLRVVRSAVYLTWRYRQHPQHRYRTMIVTRDAECLGYAIVQTGAERWFIADMQFVDEAVAVPAMINCLDGLAFSAGVSSVNVPVMHDSELIPFLSQGGFRPREGRPVVAALGMANSRRNQGNESWSLMFGDRDS